VPKYLAIAHEILAKIAITRDDIRSAEAELAAAIEILKDYPAPLVEWKTLVTLGRVRLRKEDFQGTCAAYSSAAAVIEGIASNVTEQELRSTFLNSPAVQEVVNGRGGVAGASVSD
jgi:hypothetical protein